MENIEFDRNKVIEEMKALKATRMEQLKKESIERGETEFDEERLSNLITIKYLGKIEKANEQGQLVKVDWYAMLETNNGQVTITYYDENQERLGVQVGMDGTVIISESMMRESDKTVEIPQEMKALKKEDIEKAKTLEELEAEQRTQESKENEPEKSEGPEEEKEQEPQQLPGVSEGPQLTRAQVNSMKGPKVSSNQIIDGEILGNIIGLEGEHIQFVDADTVRQWYPELQIPSGQVTMPLDVLPNGTANIIGPEKLQLSTQEGTNSAVEHTTATNEGGIRREQNLETYNITSRGGMHTIAVGYDENGGTPLEVKYGWRDVENPNKITYSELETVHEGPVQQNDDTNQFKQDASAGLDKPRAITRDETERYARAVGLYIDHGDHVELDIETATRQIRERGTGKTIEELIAEVEEENVKTIGPEENPRPH